MAPKLKRLRQRLGPAQRLNLLFVLLVAASLLLLAFTLGDLFRNLRQAHSLSEALLGDWNPGDAALALLRSRLFQLLVVLLGWLTWLAGRRRQLDQIRLRRSEQKYRSIINHAGEAIFLLDRDGRILEWNKSAESLFGEPRRAVLGRPFRDIHLCYGVRIQGAMADAQRLGRSLTFEFPFPRQGRQGGQISLTITSISTSSGQAGGGDLAFVVIARDITSEKQLETKMSETEKLAGIGQLAAGIAHQLNTPLGSILLSAQMLEDTVQAEDQAEDVRRIIRQTEQCRNIIKGLLNFARPTGDEKRRLNLGEVVRETTYLMEKNIKLAGVEVRIHETCEPVVVGNRNELDQVFFNLLSNALDAMPHGGAIDITMGDGAPGELLVEFADQGEGISREARGQVFLPFFTTKEYGKGTGLGLSIVARIVHEHGGRIEMESEQGQGTRFFLSLPKPRLDLADEDADEAGTGGRVGGRGEA